MRLWPFGKKKEADGGAGLLSFVLLKGERLPDAESVVRLANELDPSRPIRAAASPDAEAVIQFHFEGVNLMAAHMPVPVPGTEVEDNLLGSPFWSENDRTEHRSHVVVISGFSGDPGPAIVGASRLGAALLKAEGGVGWYVGSAGMVHGPEVAWDWVQEAEGDWVAMLPLWINVIVTQDQEGVHSASTLGMEGLGHREFEIVWSPMPPAAVREWLFDLCAYVLERGPIMRHGQTFGRTEDERWKIEVGASKLGKEGTVIRLGLG